MSVITRNFTKRLEVDYREYINILKLFFNPSRYNPNQSQLEQMIKDRLLELETPFSNSDINAGIKGTNVDHTSLAERLVIRKDSDRLLKKYSNWLETTKVYLDKSDPDIVKTVKDVYIYRRMNVVGAAFKYLHVSERTAYRKLNQWFEDYKEAIWNNDYTV